MSFEDNTVWRIHLALYNAPAEALPIIKTTTHKVWTEEWSGEMLHHDGTVEKIGKCKRIALDRNELTCFGSVVRVRGRICYSLESPDERLATAEDTD